MKISIDYKLIRILSNQLTFSIANEFIVYFLTIKDVIDINQYIRAFYCRLHISITN